MDIVVRPISDFSQVTLSESQNQPFLALVPSCVKWHFRVLRIK